MNFEAYANEHIYDASRAAHVDIPRTTNVFKGKHWHSLEDRPDLGISLYDSHSDGSGAVYSSTKRPVLNMRAECVSLPVPRKRLKEFVRLTIGQLYKLGIWRPSRNGGGHVGRRIP